ncbi:MAG TPA: succinate dehydrogenase cytochrome b subunit [Acidimicrobiales bacterium]|jgi:succinate dehydrogenase / fumarate reductase cytochrome b subunit|nr:succinate dehydrogenase cytochrome b subunit [Acidimicrobiales bacterium]
MAQATTTRAPASVTREPATGTATGPPRKKALWPIEFYRSALGKKYVMAVTGIIGLGFILVHMLGNLKMYVGPADFNHYSEFLRQILVPIFPHTWFLWIMRLVLIGAVVLHVHAAYSLTVINHKARTVDYQSKRDYIAANYASRTMRWSGVIVGLYIIWHLFDLSWTGTGYHYHRGDAYGNVAQSLHRPWVAAIYIVANLLLGLHLFHGVWSLFQSLGWNNPRFNMWRRRFAQGFAAVIVAGNVSFPIFILAGVVSVPK